MKGGKNGRGWDKKVINICYAHVPIVHDKCNHCIVQTHTNTNLKKKRSKKKIIFDFYI